MSWLQLHFYVDGQWSEPIAQELEDIGALAVTTTANQDQACYETLPSHSAPWQFLRVTGLFPAETVVEPILAHIKKQLPEESLQDFQVETLQDQDWERTFLASFQPLKVGRKPLDLSQLVYATRSLGYGNFIGSGVGFWNRYTCNYSTLFRVACQGQPG